MGVTLLKKEALENLRELKQGLQHAKIFKALKKEVALRI
jgi:hypothetical protein